MWEEILKYFTIDNGLFMTIAILGMVGHGVKKFFSGQLSGSLTDYIFRNNTKRTVFAVLTTVGAVIGIVIGEQVPTQAGAFIMLAFTTGFTADSTVNKDDEE